MIAITKIDELVIFTVLALLERVYCNKLCFTLAKNNGLASRVVALKVLERVP